MRSGLRERLASSRFARNALWAFAGQGLRTATQALYFVMIARALDPEGYGGFVGVTALVAVLAPFVSVGTGNLLVRAVARDPASFPAAWGNALLVTTVCGGLLSLVAYVGADLVLPAAVAAILPAIAGADLVCVRLHELATQAYQGLQRLSRSVLLQSSLSLSRLGAAVYLFVAVSDPSPSQWAWLYLVSAAVPAAFALVLVARELGRPHLRLRQLRAELGDGVSFAISLSAQTIYNDIDKTMLVRLATLTAAGTYAAAYRIVDVAFVPVRSLFYASYASYFQEGARGLPGTLRLVRRLLPWCAAYAAAAGIALWTLADLAPLLLGEDYTASASAIRWLALIPLLRMLHYFAADALTGAGFQRLRSKAQVGIGAFNVALNLVLIPTHSWRGAAVASVICEGALAVLLWGCVAVMVRRGPADVLAGVPVLESAS